MAPAALAYGIWGVAEGYIDTAVAVVMCISLGVVVDDTVHFMSKYLRARREHGMSAEDAIRYAFKTVGVALAITTITLVAGFSVMLFSRFTPSVSTGTLMSMTLALALVVDFLFLPALLLMFDGKTDYGYSEKRTENSGLQSLHKKASKTELSKIKPSNVELKDSDHNVFNSSTR